MALQAFASRAVHRLRGPAQCLTDGRRWQSSPTVWDKL
jgi:hypothetical protein